MEKKIRAGGPMFLGFKTEDKTTVTKTVWYWHKGKHTDQCSRRESSEIIPHIYGQMSFDKGAKTIQWRKDSLFNK